MQAFPNTSKSHSFKNIFLNIAFLLIFMLYLSISSIYTILPPLLGILFAKYSKDLKACNFFGMFIVLLACLLFETEKSSSIGILFLLFVFLSFLISKLSLILQETSHWFRLVYIFLPYIFYFFILQSLTIVHQENPIPFSFVILWYLFCESVMILWRE